MIDRCPICACKQSSLVHRREAQVLIHVRLGLRPRPGDFAPLTVVACGACGHMYNRDFDTRLIDRMYGDVTPTNVPVHAAMIDRLTGLADWIGAEHYAGKRVLEIGGGTGHFAFALARKASHVTVYEPCLQMPPPELGIANVNIVASTFPGKERVGPVDFISCRQTIEHVAEPLEMLKAMRAVLAPGGTAYLEMPRAEYITEQVSPIDLHLQHVQYFTAANFTALAAQAGFAPVKTLVTADEHDFGILFRATAPESGARPAAAAAVAAVGDTLDQRMAIRIATGRALVAELAGPLALYGANTMAQGTLGLFCAGRPVAAVFDDNACYAGYAMYSRDGLVSICLPERDRVNAMAAIIIAAYLHDRIIAGKLRAQGYVGRILSGRPMPVAAGENGLENLMPAA